MMIDPATLPFKSSPWDHLVLRFFARWSGTRYRSHCRVRGGGVDCVNLMAAFLEETDRLELRPLAVPKLRVEADAGPLLKTVGSWGAGLRSVGGLSMLNSGDVILVHQDRPDVDSEVVNHVMIVGPGKTVLHATPRVPVRVSSIQSYGRHSRLLRYRDRERRWVD